jgi:hypothetical protein
MSSSVTLVGFVLERDRAYSPYRAAVWCPECRDWHTHGLGREPVILPWPREHRISHCWRDHRRFGSYYIREGTPAELAALTPGQRRRAAKAGLRFLADGKGEAA